MKVQKITPFLWFDNQAEEAARFYTSVFENSRVDSVTPLTVSFTLDGVAFIALNGGPHFTFNEAISFSVSCETQEEVDTFWERLTADGGAPNRCGWLKDKYGVSWQIVPTVLGELLTSDDKAASDRVMQAMLKMVKLDIAGLRQAYDGP